MTLHQILGKGYVGLWNPKASKPRIQNFLKGHQRGREFTKQLQSRIPKFQMKYFF